MLTSIELRKLAADTRQKGQHILAKIREEKREKMTPEERQAIDKITDEAADYLAQADTLEKSERQAQLLEESAGRITDASDGSRHESRGGGKEPFKWSHRGCELEIDQSLPEFERCTPEYRKAQRAYLIGGSRAAEARSLQTAPNTQGGYLTTVQFVTQLIQAVDDLNYIRRLSKGHMLGANISMGAPSYDTDLNDADWTPEVPASAISDDTAARFGKRELTPHQYTKKIKISRKMLRSGIIDIESFMRSRMAYVMAKTEEKAFLTGDGAQQPLGLLTATSAGISTSRDVTQASSSTSSIEKNDFINLKMSFKEQYWDKLSLVMSREGVKRLMKIDDGIGRPIFIDSHQTGERPRVCGIPLYMTEYAMTTFTTGQYVALCGDFSNYWIADSLGLEIQVCDQTAAGTNQIEYFARAEVDGMPVLEEAFSRLKLA